MDSKKTTPTMTISAVIPAYNSEKYIARAIDSVLAQYCPPNEIIVVDDGSTDQTAQVVRTFGDKVILITQDNTGASAARNAGIKAAASEWIAFLDGDDEWLPGHLQAITALLKRNPHLVWATANYITCSCGEERQAPYIKVEDAERYLKNSDFMDNYFHGVTKGLSGCCDTKVIRKTTLEEAGLFRVGQKKANDLDMWWRIAYRHPQMGFVTEPAAIYHLGVAESISKGKADWKHYTELIHRHRGLADQFNQQAVFDVFITRLLKGWLRGMLFEAQKEDIRGLLSEFKMLLPAGYRALMWALTIYPNMTQAGCLLLSKIIRALRLRPRVVSPPPKRQVD